MGLRIFLSSWNDFVAKTAFGIVLENFCRIEVGFLLFLSEEGREEKFGLKNFLRKKAIGRKAVGLRIICASRREKESKVKQIRRVVRSPVH